MISVSETQQEGRRKNYRQVMTMNSSSSNSSFPPHLSFLSSNLLSYISCILSSSNIFTALYMTHIFLLLPICLFILCHRLKLRLNICSTSSAPVMSNSDFFTCHMVVMELIGIIGFTISCCAVNMVDFDLMLVGFSLCKLTWYGETCFHVLTCVDRYVAVIHPITYLTLKNAKGLMIRHILAACVWVLCSVAMGLSMSEIFIILDSCFMFISLMVIFICSLSVLCVLIRPGPGEQGGAKGRVDQSKVRAFYTIMVILSLLVLRFVWGLAWTIQEALGREGFCLTVLCALWCNLSSSLVLPLLFLQRTGKLVCRKRNSQ